MQTVELPNAKGQGMPSGHAVRSNIQAGTSSHRSACDSSSVLAEDDKAILVDGTMNANSATKPGMMPIKNLAKARGIRPQLPGCSII